MPHVLTEPFTPILPKQYGDFSYEFITDTKEAMVFVRHKNYKFFLELYQKEGKFLIKLNKSSKTPNLELNKNAIKSFVELVGAKILFSNLSSKKAPKIHKNLINLEDANDILKHKKIWVEIGFGSGRKILHEAKENPNIFHLGIELYLPSIEQLLNQCELQELNNIFVINTDARIAIEALRDLDIEKIFVHFPVPWQTAKNRRIFSIDFLHSCRDALISGGSLELRTDSLEYKDYALELFKALDLSVELKKNAQAKVVSKYEQRWLNVGKDIYDITYINKKKPKNQAQTFDFVFKNIKNLDKKLQSLTDKAYVSEDFMFRFAKRYPINNQMSIYKIIIGKKSFYQALYLLVNKADAQYLPTNPHRVKENILAHKEILKKLGESID